MVEQDIKQIRKNESYIMIFVSLLVAGIFFVIKSNVFPSLVGYVTKSGNNTSVVSIVGFASLAVFLMLLVSVAMFISLSKEDN